MDLPNFSKSKAKSAAPSQKFIEIKDIKDDVVILKNGGLRAVSIASSINFELRATEEQEALIGRFQAFLNSLDFPLQILVNSQKLNIEPYLDDLRELSKTQENELLHAQTIEYIDFIQKFVELTDIMNKSFYIIIPYNPIGGKRGGFLEKFKFITKTTKTIESMPPEKFKGYKDQLMQRVHHTINGLRQMEIRATVLNTKQLIRLFYEFYNPGK